MLFGGTYSKADRGTDTETDAYTFEGTFEGTSQRSRDEAHKLLKLSTQRLKLQPRFGHYTGTWHFPSSDVDADVSRYL